MNDRLKHGGDESIERINKEAQESEDEERDRWATAMLRKIARPVIDRVGDNLVRGEE